MLHAAMNSLTERFQISILKSQQDQRPQTESQKKYENLNLCLRIPSIRLPLLKGQIFVENLKYVGFNL